MGGPPGAEQSVLDVMVVVPSLLEHCVEGWVFRATQIQRSCQDCSVDVTQLRVSRLQRGLFATRRGERSLLGEGVRGMNLGGLCPAGYESSSSAAPAGQRQRSEPDLEVSRLLRLVAQLAILSDRQVKDITSSLDLIVFP